MELTLEILSQTFDKCNKLYFGGSLKTPKFTIRKGKTSLAQFLYRFQKKKKGVRDAEIVFMTNHPWNEILFHNVMVHEMAHYALAVRGHDTSLHGIRFNVYCWRLQRKYGVKPRRFQILKELKKAKATEKRQ